MTVNDVIADKNFVTKIMSKSTGLQHIGSIGIVHVEQVLSYEIKEYSSIQPPGNYNS